MQQVFYIRNLTLYKIELFGIYKSVIEENIDNLGWCF